MSHGARAGVRLDTWSLWRVRASTSLTRWVLYVTAGVGVAATVRFAVAPPVARMERPAPVVAVDLGAEGFAVAFARAYLTWDAARPTLHQRGLAGFVSGAIDPDVGLGVTGRGSQQVAWAEVIQSRSVGAGETVYTVAADTGGPAPSYLSVDVVRDPSGALGLGRYPALVGPPLVRPAAALDAGAVGDVTDASVSTVVGRALRNYLAGSAANLAADLAPGSVVAPPQQHLSLDQLAQLRASRGGGVLATVAAHDSRGTTYTLTYQLDLRRTADRWLVGAIQADPRT